MRRGILIIAAASLLALSGCDTVKLNINLPKDQNVLFWTVDQRDSAFRAMEKLVKVNDIAKGDAVYPLPQGAPIKLPQDVDAYPPRKIRA
jgi:hypothetical protein